MKVLALIVLVIGVSMASAAPQDIHSAIFEVINSAVPVVNVNPVAVPQQGFARPPAGGVSAFASAAQQQGPAGTSFSAQTGVSQGSTRN